MAPYTGLEIAVIGMAGRFPHADNIEEFWENLKNGADCISTFDREEAIAEGEYRHVADHASYVTSHAYLRNKEYFDATFFNYLPDEAELMDPQVRIYHELCWEALEDSGYSSVRDKHTIGVFAAGSPNPRWILHAAARNGQGLVDGFTAAHLWDVTFLSSRIAYKLNLKGPAVYMQTACSSSLVAIHHACNSLLLGECNMALAGGVCIKNYSKKGYIYQEGMIRSRDGKCRPFDRLSSGTVGGEGAGVVVLKRLKDAMRDHDHIYAVVKGTAINNDGSGKVGYTAPGVKGQTDVIRRALKMAQLEAGSISYVETHGTATQLGDAVEVEALTQVYNKKTAAACMIGSVKSNIGHLDCAAGVAGFIKAVLSLKNRQLPPSLHYTAPNPNIDFKDGTLQVNNKLTNWGNNGKPLRAGVSSFGVGGTNAHLVLEEGPSRSTSEAGSGSTSEAGSTSTSEAGRNFYLMALSAKTADSLKAASSKLANFLRNVGDINLADVESGLLRGRERFSHRKILVCESAQEAIEALSADQCRKAVVKDLQENLQHIVFMFSGQGSQYPGMACDLYQAEPYFRKTVDECCAIATRYTTLDLMGAWMGDGGRQLIDETAYTQPLLFIVEYATAKLLMHWGIKPDLMIGHSIGEYAAACISGVFALEDAIRLVVKRGALMGSLPEGGSMLSINADEPTISPLLAGMEGIDLAAINGVSSLVIAGTDSAIEGFSEKLTNLSIGWRKLRTSHAFHSFLMDGILAQFEEEVSSVRLREPNIPYVSNLTGELLSFAQINDPAYWSAHLRNTVQFSRGADTLLHRGKACFIELGPGRTLTDLVGSSLSKGNEHVLVNVLRHRKQEINDQKYLIEKLGQLWLSGIGIDWDAYYEGQSRNKLPLPAYTFEKTAYTTNFNVNELNARQSPDAAGKCAQSAQSAQAVTGSKEADIAQCINISGWKQALPLHPDAGHDSAALNFVIFSGVGSVSESLAERLKDLGHRVIIIQQAAGFNVVTGTHLEMDVSRPDHYGRLWQYLKAEGITIDRIVYAPTMESTPGLNSYEVIGERLQSGYMGLSFLARSIADDQPRHDIMLSVVTNYIASVGEDDKLDPLKATLLGPSKIMPSEIRNLTCKVIDLPYISEQDGADQGCISTLVREILYKSSDAIVALRMKARWVQHFEPLPGSGDISSNVVIKKNGCYLVTGGFGGMGLTIAKNLAVEYQAHVIITHRSEIPDKKEWEAQLDVIQAAGGKVTLCKLDVSHEAQVREFAHTIHESGIRVDGLIWAAGEADYGGIIQTRKMEDYWSCLTSKVHGLLLFEKYFPLESLDFLALFSSIGNTFYQHKFGQIGYNASNEFFENYAHYFRKRTGVHAFAINWCDWFDVGMTYKIREKKLKTSDRTDINATIDDAIYPQEGVRIFHHCVRSNAAVVAIHKGDIRESLRWYKDHLAETHARLNDPDVAVETVVNDDTIDSVLLTLFSAFFGKEDITPKDDFFELGGDSLKAMTLVSRINKTTGAQITLRDLYGHPTVEKLAVLLADRVNSREQEVIPSAGEREFYPLSSEQKKIYFLQQLDPQGTAYNETKALWLAEEPDLQKLTAVMNLLLNRHECLRTSFITDANGPRQAVRRNTVIEVGSCEWKGSVEDVIRSFIQPFDLGTDLLLRVAICKKSAQEYLLLIDSHHIVMDGISKGILVNEMLAAYAGSCLPENKLTYKDYAAWQCSAAGNEDRKRQKAFWLRQFTEEVDVLDLPYDFPRPKIFSYNNGGKVEVRLNSALTGKLREVSRDSHTTMSNVLLSAYAILLSRLSHQKDLVIGIPVSRRAYAELQRMIGMFVGVLPVRFDVGEWLPFDRFLMNVHDNMLSCIENQTFPIEELVEELKVERNPGRNPLFDVMFVYEQRNRPAEITGSLRFREEGYKPVPSRNDLTLMAVEDEDGVNLNFIYARNLFRQELVGKYASYYENILTEIVEGKEKTIAGIDLLSPVQKDELLRGFNQTSLELPDGRTVVSWFEEQVSKSPDSIALVFGETQLTYRQLDENAGRLGHVIRKKYKQRNHSDLPMGTPVALYLDRGLDMVTSMLAVLKAGAAYVPISPSYPEDRVRFILNDTQTPLVITQTRYVTYFTSDGKSDGCMPMGGCMPMDGCMPVGGSTPVVVTADQPGLTTECQLCAKGCAYPGPSDQIEGTALAYVIYTSGTTGNPKGVKINHRNLIHLICAQVRKLEIPSYRRALFFADYVFDASVFELFVSLCCGLEVYICSDEQRNNAMAIDDLIDRHNIEIATLPPSIMALMDSSKSLKAVITAGESPSLGMLKRFSQSAKVFNAYGPTENTVWATVNLYQDGDLANNIGEPINNTKVYVLDDQQRLAPVGVPGELHIGGAGLSIGYLNRPELTAARFIDNAYATNEDISKGYLKLYNSGDIVRWLPDGRLEFIGRKDFQVKIRGYRIELGEIESVLSKHPDILQAVVVDKEKEGHKYLVAYFISRSSATVESSVLKEYLASKLPNYMVPGAYVQLEAIPLTINGKVDRKKLPAPEFNSHDAYVVPANESEALLCGIWQEVLGVDRIGVNDNFFSMGGDSIKSLQVSSRLRDKGYALPVKEIFASQTVKALASTLKKIRSAIDQDQITGRVAISPIQDWFLNGRIKNKAHFNQSVMLNLPGGIARETILTIFEKLTAHHDMLRSICRLTGEGYVQEILADADVQVNEFDLRNRSNPESIIREESQKLQSGIDLGNGPLLRLALYHLADGSRLLIVIHHLVIDGISWRILFEDIHQLLDQIREKRPLSLPMKTTSFQSWAKRMSTHPSTLLQPSEWKIDRDLPDGSNTFGDTERVTFSLSRDETSALLKDVNAAYHTQINDILLSALARAFDGRYKMGSVQVDMEGHGRVSPDKEMSIERTVGWFTSLHPVTINAEGNISATIKKVKESLRSTPHYGVSGSDGSGVSGSRVNGSGVNGSRVSGSGVSGSRVSFNYLGQFDTDLSGKHFEIAREPRGSDVGLGEERCYEWEISGVINDHQLQMTLAYSKQQYHAGTIRSFMDEYRMQLEKVIRHCSEVTEPQLTLSDITHRGITQEQLDVLQQPGVVDDVYPLTPMQEGIFFHSNLDGDTPYYFEQTVIDLEGDLDIERLKDSLKALIAQHHILRTIFKHKGFERPLQIVLARGATDFTYIDVQDACRKNGEKAVVILYEKEDKTRGFDLEHGPLIRLTVLKTGSSNFTFIWSHHHILMDGWSASIVWNKFIQYYVTGIQGGSGTGSSAKYADYIRWIEERDKKASAAFWRARLDGYHQLSTIPGKRPRPAEGSVAKGSVAEGPGFELASGEFTIDPAILRTLHSRAKQNEVTLNTVLQCAWAILLGRYNYARDVVFGAVVSGRPAEIEGIETMVGLCINTLPVRVDLEDSSGSINKLLQQMQKQALEAEPHQLHPLHEIQTASTVGPALLDHILVFENYPIQDRHHASGTNGGHELTVKGSKGHEQNNYDLTVLIIPGEGLKIKFDFNSKVYSPEIIYRTMRHFKAVIDQMADVENDSLSGITIVSTSEREQLLEAFNDTAVDYPRDRTIVDLFGEQAWRRPEAVAVVFEGQELTYGELDRRSNQLAHYLRRKGVGPEVLVPICVGRGMDMIVGIWGILKAGGAYVPIDPGYPGERIQFILEDIGTPWVVTDRLGRAAISVIADRELIDVSDRSEIGRERTGPVELLLRQEHLAYMIYTSGSTGRPKGVLVEHGNVVRLLRTDRPLYDFNENDTWTLFHSFCFDFSVWEIFGALVSGGRLVIIPGEIVRDAGAFCGLLEREGVTVLNQTPGAFSVLQEVAIRTGADLRVRYVIFGGEALNASVLSGWKERYPDCRLVNMYGITETTVHVTYKEMGREEILEGGSNIGVPIPTLECLLLDRGLRLAPMGAIGEVCVGGTGWARGYWKRPELTAERFIAHPYRVGERLYRSGDLGRRLEDGSIEYMGRKDEQVKVRGYRVELGEIETALGGYAGVRQAVVVAREDGEGHKRLVGYVVTEGGMDKDGMERYLGERLPEYMVPRQWVEVASMPLTSNGKLDKKSLPQVSIESGSDYEGPFNEIEEQLTKIWSDVLKIEASRISVNRNFFELGGHSLKAVLLVNKINMSFDINFALEEVFKKRTIRSMSDYLTTILQTTGAITLENEFKNTIEIEL
jgi:iturin family lipopeptide synthetase A